MPITSPQDFKEAASRRRKSKDVEVEGVGTLRFRALSAGEATAFQSEVKKVAAAGGDSDALAFTLLARSWVAESGELWMPEEEGVSFARSLDPETFGLLAKEVLALNGLSADAIEVAEKNSEKPVAGSSPTGSPKN